MPDPTPDSRETLDPALERAARAAMTTWVGVPDAWELAAPSSRDLARRVARAVLAEAGAWASEQRPITQVRSVTVTNPPDPNVWTENAVQPPADPPQPTCDCHLHEHQVCDICQGELVLEDLDASMSFAEWSQENLPVGHESDPDTCGEPCGTFSDDHMALCAGPPGHLEGPGNRWHSPWEHDFAPPPPVPPVSPGHRRGGDGGGSPVLPEPAGTASRGAPERPGVQPERPADESYPASPGHRRGDGEPVTAGLLRGMAAELIRHAAQHGLFEDEYALVRVAELRGVVPAQSSDEVQAPTRPDGDAALELLRELVRVYGEPPGFRDWGDTWQRAHALVGEATP